MCITQHDWVEEMLVHAHNSKWKHTFSNYSARVPSDVSSLILHGGKEAMRHERWHIMDTLRFLIVSLVTTRRDL